LGGEIVKGEQKHMREWQKLTQDQVRDSYVMLDLLDLLDLLDFSFILFQTSQISNRRGSVVLCSIRTERALPTCRSRPPVRR
jgi:hypothetical protein